GETENAVFRPFQYVFPPPFEPRVLCVTRGLLDCVHDFVLLRLGARRHKRITRGRTQAWQISIGHPLVHQTAPSQPERRKGSKRPAASLSGARAVRRRRNEREEISRRS